MERALRIGLLTLCNAGVSMSADVVKAEFERLYERMEATQESAAKTLASTLREHFGDGDGRLPKTRARRWAMRRWPSSITAQKPSTASGTTRSCPASACLSLSRLFPDSP
ncbi:MAG: hypothetical protein ACR2I5_11440 [Candidatus Limnocylindria bacterium]